MKTLHRTNRDELLQINAKVLLQLYFKSVTIQLCNYGFFKISEKWVKKRLGTAAPHKYAQIVHTLEPPAKNYGLIIFDCKLSNFFILKSFLRQALLVAHLKLNASTQVHHEPSEVRFDFS